MRQREYVIWQIAQKAQEKGENKWQFCWRLAESTQPSPTDNSWVCTGSWKQNLLPTKKLSGVMSWFLITNSKWINHLLLLMLFVSSWLPENKKSHDTEIMGKVENNSLHKWITKLESAKCLWGETISYWNYKMFSQKNLISRIQSLAKLLVVNITNYAT